MPRLFLTCVLFCALLLAACSPVLQIESAGRYHPVAPALGAEQPGRAWWQLHFGLPWPEGEAPDFSTHLLVAEQLLLPVITEYQGEIPLWRFHRRASRSPAGHQFSLVFYADPVTAARVYEQVESEALTAWLLDNGLIERLGLDRRSPGDLNNLELASDPDWPMAMQRSWPWFIMGASQTWLLMVQELSAQGELGERVDYGSLLEHYRGVDERLTAQWRENGQHAYLHHLNAVFGYQPLQIQTNMLTTF